jgi:hypothetical protein
VGGVHGRGMKGDYRVFTAYILEGVSRW